MARFNEGQLQVGQHFGQNVFFLFAQIAARFLADHLQLIDEDARHRKIGFHRFSVRTRDLSEHQRDLLCLHENELDEPAGHLAGLLGILDFGHDADI